MASVFNVRDFGAAGDGVADDRAAIQAATDAAATEGGGTVFFPDGAYLIKGRHPTLRNESRLTDGVQIKSGVRYLGDGPASEIRQDINCCFSFVTHVYKPVTDDASIPVRNVGFERLRFSKPGATWFAESHHLNIDSVSGLTIERCEFSGWSGDAMSIGFNINNDLSAWLPSRVRDVTIRDNTFDGLNKNTRCGIAMDGGINVSIRNNVFRRTTRDDMPGAIDLEPEGAWSCIDGISIRENTFEDIGGMGVLCLALYRPLAVAPRNVFVQDNVLQGCTARSSYYVAGLRAKDQTAVALTAPQNIRFTRNTHAGMSAGSRVWVAGGVKDLFIEGERVVRSGSGHKAAILGSRQGDDTLDGNFPIEGLYFRDNVISGWRVSGDRSAPLMVQGAIIGGRISGNTISDCGRTGGYRAIAFAFDGGLSRNVDITDNSFINTAFPLAAVPIDADERTLFRYPATIRVRHNAYHGFDATPFTGGLIRHRVDADRSDSVIRLANAAVPSVAGGTTFVTGGTKPVTDVSGGVPGQQITIVAEHAVVVVSGQRLKLSGGVDFSMKPADALTLIAGSDGTWREVSRSVNRRQ